MCVQSEKEEGKWCCIKDGFKVCVVSSLSYTELAAALEGSIPLEWMRPIIVV
jgi:hypothetical protein